MFQASWRCWRSAKPMDSRRVRRIRVSVRRNQYSGLASSQDDLRTGERFPWMLDAPRDDAKPVGRVSGIIYIAWPPVVENGFLKAMGYGGKIGWLEQNAVRPLRRADGTTGGCTLRRRSDGRIMFDHLEPGVGRPFLKRGGDIGKARPLALCVSVRSSLQVDEARPWRPFDVREEAEALFFGAARR